MSSRPTISVSIIVCAYADDRWGVLAEAMRSASEQAHGAELVLVIDNNPALLARARDEWTDAAVIPSAGPRGLSHARNTGIAAAAGEILVFLDDDAAGLGGWLDELLRPFGDPDVLAVGGAAVPDWPAGHPGVLPPELLWIVGCSFAGQQQGEAVRNVMGCNMAFRAAALQGIGGFDTGMGRVGAVPLGAEETDVCIRLTRAHAGGRIVFASGAVVRHSVTASRATFRYVAARSFGEGISKALLARRLGSDDSLASERGYLLRVLPRAVCRELSRLSVRGVVAASAIVVSVAAAGAGYVRGRLARVPAPATLSAPMQAAA